MTGTGLNTFGAAMFQYQTAFRDQHVQEAHNDYLQLAAEGGLLLGVPITATLILFVRAVGRRFRARKDDTRGYWIRVGAVVGLMAIALQSIVEFSLQMPGNAALFVVLAAIALHRAPTRAASAPAAAAARA
jgi:O-antigen ligase